MGFSNFLHNTCAYPQFVKSSEMKKKGKRDGNTVIAQIFKPSKQACAYTSGLHIKNIAITKNKLPNR